MKLLSTLFLLAGLISTPAFAIDQNTVEQSNAMDELDPHAPDIEEQLKKLDEQYEAETGKSPFLVEDLIPTWGASCYREQCPVYIDISKAEQVAYLYVNGVLQGQYLVSTGKGNLTPDFDTHPNGRIYDRYTSTKFPGGDYVDDNGTRLGNMPYAVFIRGGFAVHGTGRGNWKYLGQKASHGCIRMHPDNGYKFNRLVRAYGIRNTWIRVR